MQTTVKSLQDIRFGTDKNAHMWKERILIRK